MAFKTGTSYGFRDAVAVGRGRRLRDRGLDRPGRRRRARPDLTGRDAALPLLFDVADQVGVAGPRPAADRARVGAPPALQTLDRPGAGPRLIFPPDGATVVADGFGAGSRGFVLAAGGAGPRLVRRRRAGQRRPGQRQADLAPARPRLLPASAWSTRRAARSSRRSA